METKYKRVILKISGEALSSPGENIDFDIVGTVAKQVAEISDMGVEVCIIVGGGNIGRAMARSDSFPRNGFETIAIFDRDEKKIGREVDGLFVQDIDCMERFVREHPVDIALLAVPARAAQGLAERLYACGVRGFWNFAPVDLYLPENAVVENVHLDESLEVLSFRILQKAASPMEQEDSYGGIGRRI